MIDRKLKIMSNIIATIAVIISLLIFIFGEGVIWRAQSINSDSIPTNSPTIENEENNSTTSIPSKTSSSTADSVTAQPTTSLASSNLGTNENNSITENNSDEDNGDNIKGTVRLGNNQNISDCPQIVIPENSQIEGQTTYEMTWNSFDGATIYRILAWKDANYETADSDIIIINEVEVSGLSYTIDLTTLEPGYIYGYNVVADNHYSSPLLIELY